MALKLITAPTAEPVSLVEVKSQLGITDTGSDAQLLRRITEARAWAEYHMGRSLMPQTREMAFDAFPVAEIKLDLPPVASIVSITYLDESGFLQTISSDDYALDDYGMEHWIIPASDFAWPGTLDAANAVKIRYLAGYAVSALAPVVTLSAITRAAPGVVTSVAHGFADGDLLLLDIVGMSEIDGALYRVYAKTSDTFQLARLSHDGAISTAAFTAFTSGTAQKVAVGVPQIIIEAIIVLVGHWTNFQARIEGGNFITRVPVAVEQMLDREKIWSVA